MEKIFLGFWKLIFLSWIGDGKQNNSPKENTDNLWGHPDMLNDSTDDYYAKKRLSGDED